MPKRNAWPDYQLEFLIKHYPLRGWTAQRIAEAMPGPPRTPKAIRNQAYYLTLESHNKQGWRQHDPALYDDVYDLAVMDLTLQQIADAIHAQHAVPVSHRWVDHVMRHHLPSGVYAAWRNRSGQRRARGVARSWDQRRKA